MCFIYTKLCFAFTIFSKSTMTPPKFSFSAQCATDFVCINFLLMHMEVTISVILFSQLTLCSRGWREAQTCQKKRWSSFTPLFSAQLSDEANSDTSGCLKCFPQSVSNFKALSPFCQIAPPLHCDVTENLTTFSLPPSPQNLQWTHPLAKMLSTINPKITSPLPFLSNNSPRATVWCDWKPDPLSPPLKTNYEHNTIFWMEQLVVDDELIRIHSTWLKGWLVHELSHFLSFHIWFLTVWHQKTRKEMSDVSIFCPMHYDFLPNAHFQLMHLFFCLMCPIVVCMGHTVHTVELMHVFCFSWVTSILAKCPNRQCHQWPSIGCVKNLPRKKCTGHQSHKTSLQSLKH